MCFKAVPVDLIIFYPPSLMDPIISVLELLSGPSIDDKASPIPSITDPVPLATVLKTFPILVKIPADTSGCLNRRGLHFLLVESPRLMIRVLVRVFPRGAS